MIAVVGISGSGRSEVDRRLDALGTNLLRVAPGDTLDGTEAKLPHEAVAMIGRIPPVQQVAATGATAAHVYRNEHIAIGRTGSLDVLAAGRGLLPAVGGHVRRGRWLDSATEEYPAVVLGSTAARRLDVYAPGTRVWLGGRWFSLVGVLDPVPLAPELDSASAGRRPGRTCASTAIRRRSMSAPRTARSRRYGPSCRPRRTRRNRARSRSPGPPTRSPPARPPSRR
jgi:putative ABC transport system permease protein